MRGEWFEEEDDADRDAVLRVKLWIGGDEIPPPRRAEASATCHVAPGSLLN